MTYVIREAWEHTKARILKIVWQHPGQTYGQIKREFYGKYGFLPTIGNRIRELRKYGYVKTIKEKDGLLHVYPVLEDSDRNNSND